MEMKKRKEGKSCTTAQLHYSFWKLKQNERAVALDLLKAFKTDQSNRYVIRYSLATFNKVDYFDILIQMRAIFVIVSTPDQYHQNCTKSDTFISNGASDRSGICEIGTQLFRASPVQSNDQFVCGKLVMCARTMGCHIFHQIT